MRRLIFFCFVALGAGTGLLIGAAQSSLGLAIFFGLKLAVVGMALGSLFSMFGRKSSKKERAVDRNLEEREEWEREEFERVAQMGSHTSPEEITTNYWRDKGRPPFMNPEDHDLGHTPEDRIASDLLDRVNPSLDDPDGNGPYG